jgi:hypothetical protein
MCRRLRACGVKPGFKICWKQKIKQTQPNELISNSVESMMKSSHDLYKSEYVKIM